MTLAHVRVIYAHVRVGEDGRRDDSIQDLALTDKVSRLGDTLGIKLVDFLVLTRRAIGFWGAALGGLKHKYPYLCTQAPLFVCINTPICALAPYAPSKSSS